MKQASHPFSRAAFDFHRLLARPEAVVGLPRFAASLLSYAGLDAPMEHKENTWPPKLLQETD